MNLQSNPCSINIIQAVNGFVLEVLPPEADPMSAMYGMLDNVLEKINKGHGEDWKEKMDDVENEDIKAIRELMEKKNPEHGIFIFKTMEEVNAKLLEVFC